MIWLFRRVSSAPSGLRGWRSLHIATGDGCLQSDRKRSGAGHAPFAVRINELRPHVH
jgi:hypothetical protein